MENYMQYHLMGTVAQVRMKRGCVPKKFECQPDRKSQTSVSKQPYLCKKRKRMAPKTREKQLQESGLGTEGEATASQSSGSPQPSEAPAGGGSGRKRVRRSRQYCMARGCTHTNTRSPHLSFFSLPKDPHRRRQWLTAVDREDLLDRKVLKCKSYVVCSSHFDDSQIRLEKHIKTYAVPCGVGAARQDSAAMSVKSDKTNTGIQTDSTLDAHAGEHLTLVQLSACQRRRLERLQRTQVLHIDSSITPSPAPLTTYTHKPTLANINTPSAHIHSHTPSHCPPPDPASDTNNIIHVKIEKVEPDYNWDEQQ